MTTSHSGDEYNVYEVGSCNNQQRGRSQTKNNSGNDKGRSQSRKKNIESHSKKTPSSSYKILQIRMLIHIPIGT